MPKKIDPLREHRNLNYKPLEGVYATKHAMERARERRIHSKICLRLRALAKSKEVINPHFGIPKAKGNRLITVFHKKGKRGRAMSDEAPLCRYYNLDGGCTWGEQCKNRHPAKPAPRGERHPEDEGHSLPAVVSMRAVSRAASTASAVTKQRAMKRAKKRAAKSTTRKEPKAAPTVPAEVEQKIAHEQRAAKSARKAAKARAGGYGGKTRKRDCGVWRQPQNVFATQECALLLARVQ